MEVAEYADKQESSQVGACSSGVWQAVSLGPARTGPTCQPARCTLSAGMGATESRGAMVLREGCQATGRNFPRQRSLPKWGPAWAWRVGSTGQQLTRVGFPIPPTPKEARGTPEGSSGQSRVACPWVGLLRGPAWGAPVPRLQMSDRQLQAVPADLGQVSSCHRKRGQVLLWAAQVCAHHCGMCV